jgi:hypothetical protein
VPPRGLLAWLSAAGPLDSELHSRVGGSAPGRVSVFKHLPRALESQGLPLLRSSSTFQSRFGFIGHLPGWPWVNGANLLLSQSI